MNIINERIQRELCRNTITKLSDTTLMKTYKQCSSVKASIQHLTNVLNTCEIPKEKQEKIIQLYLPQIIPPGTKGVIRGNEFNRIVQDYIEKLSLPLDKFDVYFEKKHPIYTTTEIPDWYIYQKSQDKILIGMNQLDIWTGGQQLNRGSKYIIQERNDDKYRLLCVVANEVQFKTEKSKGYKLFVKGFQENTLCYLLNLKHIIYEYFQKELKD